MITKETKVRVTRKKLIYSRKKFSGLLVIWLKSGTRFCWMSYASWAAPPWLNWRCKTNSSNRNWNFINELFLIVWRHQLKTIHVRVSVEVKSNTSSMSLANLCQASVKRGAARESLIHWRPIAMACSIADPVGERLSWMNSSALGKEAHLHLQWYQRWIWSMNSTLRQQF